MNEQLQPLKKQPRAGKAGRSGTQDDIVYAHIFEAILEQRLAPGTKLSEEALGEIFGVSRTIIRRALSRLAHESVVLLRPNRGAVVASPSVEEARQVFMARRLVETTFEAMWCGIRAVRPGATLGDVGHAIQQHAEAQRFSVVREYCGHGIGKVYHDEPQVLHYGRPGEGLVLQPGMTFTIEPMINEGARHTKLLPDGWTVVTKDRKLSAQWEHTIVVTEDGVEVLTLSPAESAQA